MIRNTMSFSAALMLALPGLTAVAQEIRVVTDLPGKKSAKCVVTGTIEPASL